ncbi:MAG TPA: U32 family peptidase, partial [Pseudomonadales bacterium]|nr:U32 family peptidase [Pseudomonadales bacterium]
MKISLGPILYYWSRENIYDFYQQVLSWPVSTIYLGETVCSKRRSLRTSEWIDLARALADKDRQMVLSTLTLIESESELSTLTRLCDNGDVLIEANDLAAVQLLSERHLPFVAGPALNVYNANTLGHLYRSGMVRWVPSIDMNAEILSAILQEADMLGFRSTFQVEVFAFGRMPLAYSARCFTARYRNIQKDNCSFMCLEYPEGLPVYTQDNRRILTLNGIQTQSGEVLNLLPEWKAMEEMGVNLMRLSPQ